MPSLCEPYRKLKCMYAGFTCTESKFSMKTMNQAIQTVLKNIHSKEWLPVNVTISPSTVNLLYQNHIVVNLRVSSIPFFGIHDKNERICGIIQHRADNLFLCHVLTCHTNAMELCKTLKAACELRYQQSVDSRIFTTRKSSISSLDESKTKSTKQLDKRIKSKQNLRMDIVNHIEQIKYEVTRRIYQQSNWIKSYLLRSNDESLLDETTKLSDETTDFNYCRIISNSSILLL
ncbi:Protein Fe65 isoform 1 [Schistosoma japonicum]|uniref:Protein Fe65 isoform 1 n=2 Tax=Schistosoma japonicum TaxID=6182 RepID=A0A4Z2CXW8_SCHJA|nr:Protein Fe65 isoform 1 [Schistosoma japonicum]